MSGISGQTRTLHQVQRDHILEVLANLDYNITHTSQALGISLRSLRYKLRDYGMRPLSNSPIERKEEKRDLTPHQDPQSPATAKPDTKDSSQDMEALMDHAPATLVVSTSIALDGGSLREKLLDFETNLISIALTETHNNITHAGRLLGIERTTLQQKIKRMFLTFSPNEVN